VALQKAERISNAGCLIRNASAEHLRDYCSNVSVRSQRLEKLCKLYQMKVTVVISVLALLPCGKSGKVGYEAVAYHSQPSTFFRHSHSHSLSLLTFTWSWVDSQYRLSHGNARICQKGSTDRRFCQRQKIAQPCLDSKNRKSLNRALRSIQR
jgi:hypothetical protein